MPFFRCPFFDCFCNFCVERKKECRCDKCCPKPVCPPKQIYPICPKGATGATGAKGNDGITPSFSIGSVTLDVVGGDGNVTINPASTATSIILDFVLPNPEFTATAESLPNGDTPTVIVAQ